MHIKDQWNMTVNICQLYYKTVWACLRRSFIYRYGQECTWDGGDCCEGTCIDGTYECGSVGFYCRDPDEPNTSSPDCYPNGEGQLMGDGQCNAVNNNEVSFSTVEGNNEVVRANSPELDLKMCNFVALSPISHGCLARGLSLLVDALPG